MSRLIRFKLEDGGEITVQRSTEDDAGFVASDGLEQAHQTFEAALSHLGPVMEAVTSQIRRLSSRPDEVGVELGVTLKAEAGILIAKTAAEGNIKVSLKWKPGAAAGHDVPGR